VDLLPAINITGDDNLTTFGDLARQMLTTYDAQDLRDSEAARTEVVDAATMLINQMDQFI
jgi:hypothetical protein